MHRVVRSYIPIAEKALTRNWQFKMDLVPWTVLSARLHPPLQVSVRSKFLLDTSDIYNAIYSKENLKKCLRDFQESALQIWSLLSTEISLSFLHTTLSYTFRWDDAICFTRRFVSQWFKFRAQQELAVRNLDLSGTF
jgi:hypothetical protein